MCKYSSNRYSSRFCGYVRDVIIETWERHRLWGIKYQLDRCGRTIGHLTVGEFTVTGVPFFLFAFLVSS